MAADTRLAGDWTSSCSLMRCNVVNEYSFIKSRCVSLCSAMPGIGGFLMHHLDPPTRLWAWLKRTSKLFGFVRLATGNPVK